MSDLTNKYLDKEGLKALLTKIANMYEQLSNKKNSDSEENESSGITWTVIE